MEKNMRLQILVDHREHLRFFCTHAAQPGPAGQECLAVPAHEVIAHLTPAGENRQAAQRLLAAATAVLAVFSTAVFGSFPLDFQQLRLQLPEIK